MNNENDPYSVVRLETTIENEGLVKVTRKKGFDNKGRIVLFATYIDYQDGSQGHCMQVVEADGYWRGGAYDPIIGHSIIFDAKKIYRRRNIIIMKDEFTAKMHSVLLAQELKGDDWKIMGVYGAICRGLSKTEALQKYQINEHYYDQNIDRVLNS